MRRFSTCGEFQPLFVSWSCRRGGISTSGGFQPFFIPAAYITAYSNTTVGFSNLLLQYSPFRCREINKKIIKVLHTSRCGSFEVRSTVVPKMHRSHSARPARIMSSRKHFISGTCPKSLPAAAAPPVCCKTVKRVSTCLMMRAYSFMEIRVVKRSLSLGDALDPRYGIQFPMISLSLSLSRSRARALSLIASPHRGWIARMHTKGIVPNVVIHASRNTLLTVAFHGIGRYGDNGSELVGSLHLPGVPRCARAYESQRTECTCSTHCLMHNPTYKQTHTDSCSLSHRIFSVACQPSIKGILQSIRIIS